MLQAAKQLEHVAAAHRTVKPSITGQVRDLPSHLDTFALAICPQYFGASSGRLEKAEQGSQQSCFPPRRSVQAAQRYNRGQSPNCSPLKPLPSDRFWKDCGLQLRIQTHYTYSAIRFALHCSVSASEANAITAITNGAMERRNLIS